MNTCAPAIDMERYVLDTNCLLMSIPSRSPYHRILTEFLCGKFQWCVTTEILLEYEEILTQKMNNTIAMNIINAILANKNVVKVDPIYRFQLIQVDTDDNKFVDCAIYSNAKCIVTEDNHFNILKQIDFPKVEVIDIDTFLQILA